jgi:phage terminase large subunit-like protein
VTEAVVRPPTHPNIDAYDVAVNYAKDVISGAIVAGKLVKLAAKRFLRDLKNGHERGLFFDIAAAQHVVDFFGFLRHSKGEWGRAGGQVFVLQPWQVFILANVFGWKRADGTRRFREAYIEVAR